MIIIFIMFTIIMLISCDWTDGDEGGGGGGGGSLGNHLASLAIEPPPDYDQVDNDNGLRG